MPFETTGDQIGACGIVGSGRRIVADGKAGGCNAGGIGKRQVALVAKRLGRLDLELSRARIAVEKQRLLVEVAACWGRWGLGLVAGAHIVIPYLFVAALFA